MAEGSAVPSRDHVEHDALRPHQFRGAAIDELARGWARPAVIRQLRSAERSRRLLLLRALDEKLTKNPGLVGQLEDPDDAWDLLARAERVAPDAHDLLLSHPYTGSWAGYVTKLIRDDITGVCPLWMHVGHLHAIAAAVAIRAKIPFDIHIPVWHGGAIVPTIGLARLPATHSVARVKAAGGVVEISAGDTVVRLPPDHAESTADWWGVRTLSARSGGVELSVRLDDVDPYRGLYEPVPPQRLSAADTTAWQHMLDEAWEILCRCLPDLACGFRDGLDSLVPRPAVPIRNLSASTGEAFGSAIISQPADGASLTATLVHEFHHNLLGGLLHMVPLYDHDPAERFYTLWREDPRPLAGVLSGIHAFFGVTAFWRALGRHETGSLARRAGFEFAYWRGGTWRTLRALSGDPHLTEAGQRFLASIEAQLRPMLDEAVPDRMDESAAAAAADHRAGWQLRYLRPKQTTVAKYADAWLAGLAGQDLPSELKPDRNLVPTPVPDGTWRGARTDLIRTGLLAREQPVAVPDATPADIAYAAGDVDGALRGYRDELAADSDRPDSWVGLGLCLSAREPGAAAARALLDHPELVRAVHRRIQVQTGSTPPPEELADWLGRSTC
jgi:HEXXH motif-containing protein